MDYFPMVDSYQQFEKRLERTNLAVVFIAIVLTLVFHSVKGATSIAIGGAISYVNFHWLKQAVNHLILNEGKGTVGRRIGHQYVARYALIGLVLYVTIRFTLLDLPLVLAGLFSYVLAVLLESILEIARSLLRVNQNGRT